MSAPEAGPTIHGVYDYWLRGGQHRRADREVGQAIADRFPSVPVHVRAAQDFHLRVARWGAERGISRFIHTGHLTALPEGRNVHDAARDVNPDARVIYAGRDAEARDWAAALLSGLRGTMAVLSGKRGIMAQRPVRALLSAGEPACVIIGLLLHFDPPEAAPARVARIARALPPGSVLAVSVALPDGSLQAAELAAMFTPARVYRHTAEDVTGWLGQPLGPGRGRMGIVLPGVADVRLIPGWTPGELAARPPGIIAGGVAVKPLPDGPQVP